MIATQQSASNEQINLFFNVSELLKNLIIHFMRALIGLTIKNGAIIIIVYTHLGEFFGDF